MKQTREALLKRYTVEYCSRYMCYRCAEYTRFGRAYYEEEETQWLHDNHTGDTQGNYEPCLANQMRLALIGRPSRDKDKVYRTFEYDEDYRRAHWPTFEEQ